MNPKATLDTALHREDVSAIEALILLQDREHTGQLLEVANVFNRRFNNNVVTFVRSKKIHYTNVCRADCKFCSFAKKKKHRQAFSLSAAEILRSIRDAGPIRQVALSGGHNSELNLAYHLNVVRTIREEYPNLTIQGYAPSEVFFIARRARTTPYDVLRRLQNAGLDSLSGDSADILNDKIRKKICSDKLRTADWVEIIRTAHRMGMPTTATMLFGHVEDEIHICEHLEIIKSLQQETGGIAAFEPIPFVPKGTTLGNERKIRTMIPLSRILQVTAVARVFFGRLIGNIQVDWTKVGLPNALKCMEAGANDLGGLAVDSHEIRINGKLSLQRPALRQAIRRAGHMPQERDPYTMRSILLLRARKQEPVLV